LAKVKDKVEDLNALFNSLEGEEHVANPKNEELEDLIVPSHEEDLNDEICEVSIEDDVLPLVPEEASCNASTYMHETDISTATTFSILEKGLVSQCDVPFQILNVTKNLFMI
jgi:hypothetical protein